MNDVFTKPTIFIGSSKKDLRKFPKAVCRKIGYDLYLVEKQEMPNSAKSLKGLPGVMELVERYDTDTYRYLPIRICGEPGQSDFCFALLQEESNARY